MKSDDLSKELSEARGYAKARFGNQSAEPMGGGVIGMKVGVIFDAVEFGADVRCAYKEVFLQRGEAFTAGYVEGRRGRLSNLFSNKYRAAQDALRIMRNDS